MTAVRIFHVVLIAAAFAAGCGGASQEPSHMPAAEPSVPTPPGAVKRPGEAGVGDRTTCPVSGEEFVVTDSSPKVEHEGKTYYFCCPGCDKKFKANPAQYIKPSTS